MRSRGRSWADGPVVARVLPNAIEPPQNRYAVVAGKKVGGAVQRNRLKRLVREALRRLDPDLVKGHDLVIVVRGGVDELTGYDIARGCLERITRRAGLLPPPPSPVPTVPPTDAMADTPVPSEPGADAAAAPEPALGPDPAGGAAT